MKDTFWTRLWSFGYIILFFEIFYAILYEFFNIDYPVLLGAVIGMLVIMFRFDKKYSEFVLNYAIFRSGLPGVFGFANEMQRQQEEEERIRRQFFRNMGMEPEPDIDLGFGQRNDGQNVHDSQVLATIKVSIQKLRKETKIVKNEAETLKEVRQLAMNEVPCEKGFTFVKEPDVIKSLDAIEKNTEFIESVDCGEVEALVLVWNRILQHTSEKQKDLKEILIYELKNMQGKYGTYCATGRISRLIDTLNIVDPKVKIVPFYAINEEMMNKSSKIRDSMMNEYPDKEKLEFEQGTSVNQEAFDASLKETILKELRKDYVLSGILTEEKFTKETSKWIDCI